MQQTGTLRKRKRRNLAKVTGLGIIPYDETDDAGRDDVGFRADQVFYPVQRNGDSTRIKMSFLNEGSGLNRRSSDHDLDDIDNVPDTSDESYWGTQQRNEPLQNPYILNKSTVNRLRQLLVLGMTSGAFPWKWNKKTFTIELWSPLMLKAWQVFWVFYTINTCLLTVFQFYSFYARVTGSHHTYRQIFMNSLSVYWYICAVYFNVNLYLYKDQIRQYINTMFAMNKSYSEKFILTTKGYKQGGMILINLSIPSNCSQVFASAFLFLVMPYQPWYLYSYVYQKSNPWYFLIPGFLHEFMVVGQVITSYMMTSWICVAHTNTVDFWLKEIHLHNDTGYTKDSIRQTGTAVDVYRTLQILCTCFNECMSPMAIPFVKIHIMTGLIPCGYVLIRSMNQTFIDEFPGILTYPIGVIDCATAGFALLSMSAEMFDLGCSFVESWGRTKQMYLRRILRSCPTLKVKVGHYYHITVSTTITFFRTTTDYIIDCIITFP